MKPEKDRPLTPVLSAEEMADIAKNMLKNLHKVYDLSPVELVSIQALFAMFVDLWIDFNKNNQD